MSLEQFQNVSSLLRDLSEDSLSFLESISEEVAFTAGSVIFSADEEAERFFLVTDGRVGLQVSPPNGAPLIVETIGHGEILGISWLFAPYRWTWRAVAVQPTVAISFDAAAVRQRLVHDVDLAVHVYRTVADEAVRRSFRGSQGTPRQINRLARRALVQSTVESRDDVDGRFMRQLIDAHPLYARGDR